MFERASEYLPILLFVTMLPYVLGFYYLQAYYLTFGIQIQEVGLGYNEVALASISVLLRGIDPSAVLRFVVVFAMAVLAVLLFWVSWTGGVNVPWRNLRRILVLLKSWPVSIFLFAACVAFGQPRAVEAGRLAGSDQMNGFPPVIVLNSNATPFYPTTAAALEGQLFNHETDRLVFVSDENYFIVRRSNPNATPITIRLPRSSELVVLSINDGVKLVP